MTRRFVAMAVIALWAVVVAGPWQATAQEDPIHLPHAVSTGIGADSHVLMPDHAHLSDGSAPHMPESFTAAVLPRTVPGPAAMSVVAFLVGCLVLCGCAAVQAQRGPPDRRGVLVAGRELLTRICIARR